MYGEGDVLSVVGHFVQIPEIYSSTHIWDCILMNNHQDYSLHISLCKVRAAVMNWSIQIFMELLNCQWNYFSMPLKKCLTHLFFFNGLMYRLVSNWKRYWIGSILWLFIAGGSVSILLLQMENSCGVLFVGFFLFYSWFGYFYLCACSKVMLCKSTRW